MKKMYFNKEVMYENAANYKTSVNQQQRLSPTVGAVLLPVLSFGGTWAGNMGINFGIGWGFMYVPVTDLFEF